jgi:MraZ protein
MFRGRFEHTLDSKGRFSIPSRFRDVLNEHYDSRLVVTTYSSCLVAYPFAEWRRLEEKVLALPEFNKDTRALLRHFYSKATDCAIDKLGRILIPPLMRDYAKLDKDVILVGALRYIEIWDRGSLLGVEASTSEDYIVNTLERLGL